jgi:hypothetical protein
MARPAGKPRGAIFGGTGFKPVTFATIIGNRKSTTAGPIWPPFFPAAWRGGNAGKGPQATRRARFPVPADDKCKARAPVRRIRSAA